MSHIGALPRLAAVQPLSGLGCCEGFWIELQPKPVGQPGQIVEDADDVRDFKNRLIVEAQLAQRPPVLGGHPRGHRAELLGYIVQCAIAI